MKIIKLSPINWLSSMDNLSIGAFYLLNVLYRHDINVNDNILMLKTGHGLSTHRKYKNELINKGYLTVTQINRAKYKYEVKDPNVK